MSKSKKFKNFKNYKKEEANQIKSADELNDLIEGKITFDDFMRDGKSEAEEKRAGMHQIFSDMGFDIGGAHHEEERRTESHYDDDSYLSDDVYHELTDNFDDVIEREEDLYVNSEEDSHDVELANSLKLTEEEEKLTTNDIHMGNIEKSPVQSKIIHGRGFRRMRPFTKFEVAGNGYSVFTDIRSSLDRYQKIASVDDNDELDDIIDILVNYMLVHMYPSYIYPANEFTEYFSKFKKLKSNSIAKVVLVRVNDYIFVYMIDRNFVGTLFSYVNEFVSPESPHLYTAYTTFLSDIARNSAIISGVGIDENLIKILDTSADSYPHDFIDYVKNNQDENETISFLEDNPAINISYILRTGAYSIEDFEVDDDDDEVMPPSDDEDEEDDDINDGKVVDEKSLKDFIVKELAGDNNDEEEDAEEREDVEDEEDETDDLFDAMKAEGAEKVETSSGIDALTPSNKTVIPVKK